VTTTPREIRLYDVLKPGPQGEHELIDLAAKNVSGKGRDAIAVREFLKTLRPTQASARVKEMLDIDLLAAFAQPWSQVDDVQEKMHESERAKGASFEAKLLSHKIKATFKPRLVVTVANVTWMDVEFEIEAEATIGGLTLAIKDGRLAEANISNGEVSISLSLGGQELVDFTRTLSLSEAYPIKGKPD
jgi:hypothetical protein